MIDFPKTTTINKFIPKEKFYNKTNVDARMRQLFTNEIEKITWTHKISPDTLNISSKDYSEIQVFEIIIKGYEINQALLKHIDSSIPYPILFIIKKPSAAKAVISYKEPKIRNENQMKVDQYFDSGWSNGPSIEIIGRSVDEIYKNFIFQISSELKNISKSDLKSSIQIYKENITIKKKIDAIDRQIAIEPSIARRQELARSRSDLESGLR